LVVRERGEASGGVDQEVEERILPPAGGDREWDGRKEREGIGE
jgi:hypothetical protein